jgi:ribosomal protein L16/L10AE
MGKGKGSFDHWAARVAVNQILFEIRGAVHEKVIRDAFRLAGNKLPGTAAVFLFFNSMRMLTAMQGSTSSSARATLLLWGSRSWMV